MASGEASVEPSGGDSAPGVSIVTTEDTHDAESSAASAASIDPHSKDADAIIKRHAAYAAASGVIPIPLADLAVASTLQLRMLGQLSELYGIPFSEQAVKGTVATLVASVLPLTGIGTATFSLMRAVPVVGPVLGFATLPALYSAVTYALGRTFAWHFAKGGTLQDLNVQDLGGKFKREFKKARPDAEPQPG